MVGDGTDAGGLVASNQTTSGNISNSYATGAVTGEADSEIGGFIGENDSTIEDSYSTGAVSGGTGSLVGGFAGLGGGFTDCYWDVDTSGTDIGNGGGNESGLTGLTTEQLQSGLPSGFDPAIWAENSSINTGFPYLTAIPPKK